MTPVPELVTCIMPTRDRRPFVPLAIACFLAQDYPHRELLVLDDGDRPVADFVPSDPRIRYERVEKALVLGAKRNLACRLAEGDLIAHWDDDDWSAPQRLSSEVAALQRSGADVVGLDELLFVDLLGDRAWRYLYPKGSRPWVAGGTMCYRRSFWEAHPFSEISVGEDSRFVWTRGARVTALDDVTLYAATVHSGNTSTRRPRSPRWRPVAVADVRAVMGEHATAAYRAAASGEQVATPPVVAGEPHVVVTIPYYRCRAHVRQCVESVLGQTHRNLTAVVVNDGDPKPPWDVLAGLDDPRLVRFDLPRNRGRYFADQVVLEATTSDYLMIHDADDWSEPQRVAVLLRALRAEHAIGAVSIAKGRPQLVNLARLTPPPGERLVHLANLHGVFRTDALRAIGGLFAGFTVGYDTFLVNALVMTGRIAPVPEPLYTWRLRADSLTQSPATGPRSMMRRRTAEQLREMHRTAHAAYTAYLAGRLELDALAATISRLGRARIEPALRGELDEQSKRLAVALANDRPAAAPPAPVQRTQPVRSTAFSAPADVIELLDSATDVGSAWSISRPLAIELAARLESRRPRRILELGSGLSTALLAQHARRRKASVVTLEHDAAYAERTHRLLERLGLSRIVDLRVAPLRPWECPDARRRPFYDTDPGRDFDFALIDGPPVAHGRGAALFAIWDRLGAEWDVWLDDAGREHEQDCLRLWRRHLPFTLAIRDLDGKGLAVLTPADGEAPAAERAVDGLGVGVLTGGRPDLMRRTLDALAATAAPALEAAHVLVLVNGPDAAAERYLRGLPFVDRVQTTPRRQPVGQATTALMRALAATPGVELLLHLEDDWEVCTLSSGWLTRAAEILRSEPGVGQVRLRHRSDRVLKRHMITSQPLSWAPSPDVLRSPSAHFTFNPSMIRAGDVPLVFPALDERSAQRRFLATGMGTAQLSPGVFRHVGERRGLAARRAARSPARTARRGAPGRRG
jgi:glycosyltransferase involved in cell wall biosynthesis